MINNLKEIRSSLGITGIELAELVGVSHSMIYMIENGRKNPSMRLAGEIARVLGKSIEEIFFTKACHGKLPKD